MHCSFIIKIKTNMNATLTNYLSQSQYNRILKYWKLIGDTSDKLEQYEDYDYNIYIYDTAKHCGRSGMNKYNDMTLGQALGLRHNRKQINKELYRLRGLLAYYQQEYEKYIKTIGYTLDDRTYDEKLFNILNNGILID